MDIHAHPVAKRRIEWSALLLFVLGLGSMASPHMRLPLHLHHHSGGSTSSSNSSPSQRGSRHSRRSANGGAQTELDRHGSDTARASQGVRPRGDSSAVMHAASVDAAVLLAALLSPPDVAGVVVRVVPAVPPVSLFATDRRGRAPPTV